MAHHQGKLRQERKAGGTQRSRNNEGTLLPLHVSFGLLSYTAQDHLSRGSTVHSGLSAHTSVINQESVLQTLPTGQFYGGGFSAEIPRRL